MAFVFKTWASIEELFLLIPSFLATGIAIGLFFSVLPLKRPLRFSFLVSGVAPLLSFLIFFFLQIVISVAVAGAFGGAGEPNLLVSLALIITISIAFGFVSMLGCFLGLQITNRVKAAYITSMVVSKKKQNKVEIKAAQIGAATTVAVSIVSAFVSIFVAFIN